MLRSLNSHLTGYVGLAIGGSSLLGAIAAFFHLLANPNYLVALFIAMHRAKAHQATPDDILCIAQLVAAFFAIIGGLTVALVASYLGRPSTIPSSHS